LFDTDAGGELPSKKCICLQSRLLKPPDVKLPMEGHARYRTMQSLMTMFFCQFGTEELGFVCQKLWRDVVVAGVDDNARWWCFFYRTY